MLVINRSNDTFQVAIHNSTSFLDIVPVGDSYKILQKNHAENMKMDADPGYAYIYKGASRKREEGSWHGGPFKGSDTVLIQPATRGYTLLNYTAVKNKWDSVRHTIEPSANAIEPGIEVATILLTSLVTGVAALGDKGALPSGMMMGVGSLLLMSLGMATERDAPPPPPDLPAIEAAMEKIVTEAVDSRTAKEHANRLIEASVVLKENGNTAHSQLLGSSDMGRLTELSSHDYWDFRDTIEYYAKDTSEFWNSLTSLYNDPDTGRYVLPALFAGISARLQFWRMHDFVRMIDGARITDESLGKFLRQIDRGIEGFTKAKDALNAKIGDDIKSDGVLLSTPEGAELRRIITFRHTGSESLAFAEQALYSLKELRNLIQQDLNDAQSGRPITHYWKPAWNDVSQAPIPPRPGS